MKAAFEILKYKLKSELNSLREFKTECKELNQMFMLDEEGIENFDEEQNKIIEGYLSRIADYKKAIETLKAAL